MEEGGIKEKAERVLKIRCYKVQKMGKEYEKWKLRGCADGITSDGGLMEIKCRMKEVKKISMNDYTQVQSYLQIYDMNKCYYVQKLHEGNDINIERIERDEIFWENEVIPKVNKYIEILEECEREIEDNEIYKFLFRQEEESFIP